VRPFCTCRALGAVRFASYSCTLLYIDLRSAQNLFLTSLILLANAEERPSLVSSESCIQGKCALDTREYRGISVSCIVGAQVRLLGHTK
jgi:hypothetical protein